MKPSFVSPILEKIAREMGAEIHIEPAYGYVGQVVLPDGRKRYFRNTNFDINLLGASEIARDKEYAAYFMRLLGYPVPEGEAFFTDRWVKVIGSERNWQAGYSYARSLGFPVIVKPNSKSQGSGVCKVSNKKEFRQAVNALSRTERVFLVQKLETGDDYRLVVLDDEVISTYQRLALTVVGDGVSSIQKLLAKKQDHFQAIGRDTTIPADDFRITNRLKRAGLSKDSVLSKAQEVVLLANANLSTGGDSIDVTEKVHPAWRSLAIRLTKDMGLRYCGVDVMVRGYASRSTRVLYGYRNQCRPRARQLCFNWRGTIQTSY